MDTSNITADCMDKLRGIYPMPCRNTINLARRDKDAEAENMLGAVTGTQGMR